MRAFGCGGGIRPCATADFEHHHGGSVDNEVDSLAFDFENEANALQDMVTGRLFQLKQKLFVANHLAVTRAREEFERDAARRVRGGGSAPS